MGTKKDYVEVDGVRYTRRLVRLAAALVGDGGGPLTQAHVEALWAATHSHGTSVTTREQLTLDMLVVKHGLADASVGEWLEQRRVVPGEPVEEDIDENVETVDQPHVRHFPPCSPVGRIQHSSTATCLAPVLSRPHKPPAQEMG
jgi:hypothetical protein